MLAATLRRPPPDGVRWHLTQLAEVCPVLARLSPSGVYRRLQRWGWAHKRSRDYLHSPDPAYAEKVAAITAALAQARATPATHVLLYADEFTYYRQPCPGYAYMRRGSGGHHQPLARYSYRSNTKRRVGGALDAITGQVHWLSRSKCGLSALKQFLRQVRAAYALTQQVTLVWDNWPVHAHPELVHLAASLQIRVLHTPTYAPWTNPIEKLWHQLKADVLRLHRRSDAWEQLQAEVAAFLDQFAQGSPALLKYVGLASEKPGQPLGSSP